MDRDRQWRKHKAAEAGAQESKQVSRDAVCNTKGQVPDGIHGKECSSGDAKYQRHLAYGAYGVQPALRSGADGR
jgi:hypothetical protein